ncbi:putative transcription factor protein [Eutypa lata UCREL1]|uniref:Putative transcription factor protein n=1 Tax=Eutypa lata (strain UCR-EL1) TaxID=1287681 RepID=M7T767_EUTLA|nr:putative transcription factor protein [Eutypa lata UCREL1]
MLIQAGLDEMDTCLTTNHDEDPCSVFIDPTIATPSFIADLSAWTPSSTQDVHAARLACLLDPTSQGDELHEFDVCFCIDQIIAANATMQVKLVWATSLNGCSTSSIDDMLQCQKNVLASCETFFGCKKCSLRSDYVVLVISMCREMVNGVKALEVITSPEARSSRRPHPCTELFSKGKLEAGGWRLDDDDEIEIIRHLIQVRITKLKKLIGQLEHTVSANHASYAWVVGNLRKSLDEKLGSTALHTNDMMDLNG